MSMRDKIAKAILGGKVGGPTPQGIHVYHSSPHDFDRFDLSKIGTGEGAQVYGHGIYAAENPAVSGQGGQYWQQFLPRFEGAERFAADRLKGNAYDRDAALKIATDEAAYWKNLLPTLSPDDKGRDYVARMAANQQKALELLQSGAPVGPRTYEVNFRAKPEELLDWDKPMTAQPQVLDRLRSAFEFYPVTPKETGASVYTGFVGYPYSKPGTTRDEAKRIISDRMGEAGIPGIRYLDEGSRGIDRKRADLSRDIEWARNNLKTLAPEYLPGLEKQLAEMTPTHNYVAFDPSKLDIMAKYGVVGGVPLGAATMGGTIDQSSYGARQ